MAHEAVQRHLDEGHGPVRLVLQAQVHLTQPEQVEVVDHERRREEDHPPEPEQGLEQPFADRAFDVPDHAGDRLPLPAQQRQHQAREQHIGAAFGRLRHDAGPAFLESRARHEAVLEGEQGDQGQIDQHRRRDPAHRRGVDGLRHHDVAEETDQVEQGGNAERVADDAVDEDAEFHGTLRWVSWLVRAGGIAGSLVAGGFSVRSG